MSVVHNIAVVLANVNGNTFIGLDTRTNVPLKGGKKNPMQGRVTKLVTRSQVMVFQNRKSNGYDNMVKRRLEKEGKDPASFVLSPRKWGERIQDTPFVRHFKDGAMKHYLEVIFLRPGKIEYFLDDQPIDKTEVIGLDITTLEGEQGGLDDKVVIRSYDVASLVAIRVDHQEYIGKFGYQEVLT